MLLELHLFAQHNVASTSAFKSFSIPEPSLPSRTVYISSENIRPRIPYATLNKPNKHFSITMRKSGSSSLLNEEEQQQQQLLLLQRRQAQDDIEANQPRLTRYRRETDPFLVVCGCLSFVTVVAALLCMVVNIISASQSFKTGEKIFDGILRCYAIAISLFVAVAETEWERVLKFWRVLDYWVGRGMLQIFIAVMTKALSESTSKKEALIILQDVASYMMLSCGFVYVIAGLLCCGALKRSRMKKAISREQAAKEIEELERRREELTGLLSGRD